MFPVELLVQLFALQIGQDSSIYVLEIIFGWVYDVIIHPVCICYTFVKSKYLQN